MISTLILNLKSILNRQTLSCQETWINSPEYKKGSLQVYTSLQRSKGNMQQKTLMPLKIWGKTKGKLQSQSLSILGNHTQLDGGHCRATQSSSRGRSRHPQQNGVQAVANSSSSEVPWPCKAVAINASMAFLTSWSWIGRANVLVLGNCFYFLLCFWGPDQCKHVCSHQTKHTLTGTGSSFLIPLHSALAAVGQHSQWIAI